MNAVLFSQVLKLCTDLDLDLLYILILGTCSKFALKNNVIAPGVCFLQTCQRWPQVCRVKITCVVLLTNRFVSTTKKSMKCNVKWIPLRIRIRSRNTQPHLRSCLLMACSQHDDWMSDAGRLGHHEVTSGGGHAMWKSRQGGFLAKVQFEYN